MFDLGWTEMLVVGIVALIVVGPKDLPMLFRNVGRYVGKAKGMAREFSRAMNDAADESGIKDVAKGLKTASNPVGSVMDGVKEATRDLASSLDPGNLDPTKPNSTKPKSTKPDPDSETGKLAAERAETVRKMQASAARSTATRKAREAAEALSKAEEAEAAVAAPDPAPTSEAKSKP